MLRLEPLSGAYFYDVNFQVWLAFALSPLAILRSPLPGRKTL